MSRKTIGYSALLSVIFLAAFLACGALLGRYLPFPDVMDVREKAEYLARHGDEYDVLFIGSSRVHQHILPTIFDRVAGLNGLPVKSFNVGVPAMVSPESGYLLEEILRCPHRRLRWVFMELTSLGSDVWGEDTSRFAYWHDTARLMFMARLLQLQALGRQQRLVKEHAATFSARWNIWTTLGGKFCAHARAWLIRGTNISRGSDILNRWLEAPGWRPDTGENLGENGDGWLRAKQSRQQMTGPLREKYEREYADRLATPAGKDRGVPICQVALERSLAAITNAGARPVLLVPPTTTARNFYPLPEREPQLAILDFTDVRQYPELFVPEHRMDVGHLNTAGAEIFTEMLARRFVELAKGRASSP